MILHKLSHSSMEDQILDIKNHADSMINPTIFHCYWNHNIGYNQIFSILSCYTTNIIGTDNKIILWTEDREDPNFAFLRNFCEIRYFEHFEERKNTPLEEYKLSENIRIPSIYSDYVRYIILSKYGGVYFDLDIFFFKKFNYLIDKYQNFVYAWERQNYPNGAIYYVSPVDKKVIDKFISYFIEFGSGHFGFQDCFNNRGLNQKYFNFESDIELNVLPCAWFDPEWINKECNFDKWFVSNNNQYFYDDVYCYHWHNRNNLSIENSSPFERNILKIKNILNL